MGGEKNKAVIHQSWNLLFAVHYSSSECAYIIILSNCWRLNWKTLLKGIQVKMLLFSVCAHAQRDIQKNMSSPFLEHPPHPFKTTEITTILLVSQIRKSAEEGHSSPTTTHNERRDCFLSGQRCCSHRCGHEWVCRGEGGGGWMWHRVGCGHTLHSEEQKAPALWFPDPTVYLWGSIYFVEDFEYLHRGWISGCR